VGYKNPGILGRGGGGEGTQKNVQFKKKLSHDCFYLKSSNLHLYKLEKTNRFPASGVPICKFFF